MEFGLLREFLPLLPFLLSDLKARMQRDSDVRTMFAVRPHPT